MNRRLTAKVSMAAVGLALLCAMPMVALAQPEMGSNFQVNNAVDSVDLITGTSRRLKFDYTIPEVMVENPDIVKVNPVGADEILVTGLKPGLSTVTLSDVDRNLQTITVHVSVDTRKLEHVIRSHFPGSQVSVHPLETGVLLRGFVAKASHLENIVAVASDYFPSRVINQLQVDGSQLVAIKVKVYEVSRTKLRNLGVDWAYLSDDFNVVSSVSQLINSVSTAGAAASGQTMSFGVLNDDQSFSAFIQALEQNNLAKLLDQPTLVTQHGRPAEFLSGGEIPIAVASGLGTTSIEFRPFGTKLDVVPLIHGGGEMTLEVRAEVSEVANDLSNNTSVPGFRVRRVNTGVKMMAGQTLALAGDYREELETEVRGIPHLMDHPWFGAAFRRTEEIKNETELVFLITPKFISPVEASRLPRLGPGQMTASPSDYELYMNGYTEVPRCNDDCPVNDRFDDPRFDRSQQPDLLPQATMQEGAYEAFHPEATIAPQQSDANQINSGNSIQPSGSFRIPATPASTSTDDGYGLLRQRSNNRQARTAQQWPSQTRR